MKWFLFTPIRNTTHYKKQVLVKPYFHSILGISTQRIMPLNLPIETLFKQVSTRRLSGNAQVVRKYHLLLKNVQEVQNLRNTEDFASESSYRIPEVQSNF